MKINHAKLMKLKNNILLPKSKVASGHISKDDIFELLNAFSPKNEKSHFSLNQTYRRDLQTGKVEVSHQFKITVKVSDLVANLFKDINRASNANFPFTGLVEIERTLPPGTSYISVSSTKDFLKETMKNPRHVASVNTEAYAKYATFRTIASRLAKSGLYQFINSQEYAPAIKQPKSANPNMTARQILALEKAYVASDPQIDALINDALPAKEIDNLKMDFSNAAKLPMKIAKAFEIYEKQQHQQVKPLETQPKKTVSPLLQSFG